MSETFERVFGRPSEVRAHAPGRVNLLGEHTDYNEGFVLPTATTLRTTCELALRTDDRVVVYSEARAELRFYRVGFEQPHGEWIDYVAGVTWALRQAGHALQGFELVLASQVPVGGGLSSSAALEVACLRALRERLALPLDDLVIARLAHHGESGHVGVPVGLLDPLACSLGDPTSALFIDTRSLAIERIALPDDLELAVIDSGVAHDHASGGYRIRRAECEQAARMLGVTSLREATLADVAGLPPPLDRRARHVVTENERVLAGALALRSGDLAALGELFYASHASLRDDYESSVPAADALVERARTLPSVFGARITGGGFGGAVIACVRRGDALAVARALATDPTHVLLPGSVP